VLFGSGINTSTSVNKHNILAPVCNDQQNLGARNSVKLTIHIEKASKRYVLSSFTVLQNVFKNVLSFFLFSFFGLKAETANDLISYISQSLNAFVSFYQISSCSRKVQYPFHLSPNHSSITSHSPSHLASYNKSIEGNSPPCKRNRKDNSIDEFTIFLLISKFSRLCSTCYHVTFH